MTITGGSALSKEDIDRMVAEAEEYAEADRTAKEAVETRNSAEALVHSTEKFLDENDDKLDEALKAEVKTDIEAVNEALAGEDLEAVKTAVGKLGESSQKLGAALYEQAAAHEAAAEQSPEDAEGVGDDDVVEAEIIDEEDETK